MGLGRRKNDNGSSQAMQPRWLAREDHRQWIVGAIGISVLVPLLLPGFSDFDEASTWSDRLERIAVPVIFAYAVMQATSVLSYVPLTLWAFRGAAGEDLATLARFSSPRNADEERQLRWAGFDEVSTAIGAGGISLICVLAFIIVPGVRESPLATYGALVAMVGSWILIVVAFAVRYMRDWAADGGEFIESREAPSFVDFLLVSLQVSTGYNLAKGMFETRRSRRNALIHNVIAYVFNTVIIALVISVALPAAMASS